MSVILTQKAKCFGCHALERGTDPTTGKPNFSCQLGFALSFVQGARQAMSPRPTEKCYKPTTKADLKDAKAILERKAARQQDAEEVPGFLGVVEIGGPEGVALV